jgi:hypothetical protein
MRLGFKKGSSRGPMNQSSTAQKKQQKKDVENLQAQMRGKDVTARDYVNVHADPSRLDKIEDLSKKEFKKKEKEKKKIFKTARKTASNKEWFKKNLQKKYKKYADKYNLTEEQIQELLGYGRDLTYEQLQGLYGDPSSRNVGGDYLQSIMELNPSKRKKPGDEGYKAHSNPLGLMYSTTDPSSRIELPGVMGKLQGPQTFSNFMSGLNRIGSMEKVLGQTEVSQKDIDNYLSLTMGKGGTDIMTGNPIKALFSPQGGDGRQEEWQRLGYPSYAAWLAAQGGGGGGGATVPPVDEESEFQQSLTGTADTPNYYVGTNPLASNIAWGKQADVDPRTMGIYNQSQAGFPTWAAEGGRIPAAFGGIMDTETGRRAYGIGSFFKKIGRAAKKVLKSPIGKIGIGALAMGMPWGAGAKFGSMGGQGWFGGQSGWGKLAPFLRGATQKGVHGKSESGWLRNLFSTDGKLNPWKLGIAGLTALPFFMGGKEEDEDSKFDYMGAKNAYRDELMRIKAGSLAGTLDPNKFVYYNEGGRARLSNGGDPLLREEYDKYVFEMKEMGITPMSFEEFAAQARAGMYAGGQSVPSDYTMEDAMMTTTQDKLGGITDVMKQADLYRQGDVGQFYAADGGRIGYQSGGDLLNIFTQDDLILLKEFKYDPNEVATWRDKGKGLLNTLRNPNYAQGGRIGYDAGGQTGHPPITTGQVPQVPPQMPAPPPRPHPMPAPQPNRMAMNPMMNRPMMNPMGGRRMAQEGGLMDLGGMEKDYRQEGGFVPLGGEEKADDVPARLSKNEFVFTADAVRGAGDGDIDKGAEIMENIMENLEQGGQISEETQGLTGAQEMFGVSERLSEVV